MKIHGKTLSPGMGKGRTFIYKDVFRRFDEFYYINEAQVEDEINRFHKAIKKISEDLSSLAAQVKCEIDSKLSGIFKAHITIIQDSSLKKEIENKIREESVNAGYAVKSIFRKWEKRFQSLDTEIARQKSDDMRDLARRLLYSLAGIQAHALENIPEGSVLVARRLLPSDTIFLSRQKASAALLEIGGSGSHAALFAHEIGLPCISGLEDIVENTPDNILTLVDANAAEVIYNPTDWEISKFDVKLQKLEKSISESRKHSHKSAVTRTGKKINVYANVGSVDDTVDAIENGADGIGLYRTEQVYLGRQTPPSPEELFEELTRTLKPARELPVYVRLLDLGADKPLPFLDSISELNPSLGLRGIRFLYKYPELLKTQLKALVELSRDFDLHILIPMVTLPDDMKQVKEMLLKFSSTAGIKPPKIGAMIETPAAVFAAKELCEYSEFISLGTNDLTQYTFASDRENSNVDRYFDDTNDIIFRMINIVNQAVSDTPLSICGELAIRPEYTAKLLQNGITTLSVAPPAIPMIKDAVRNSGI